MQLIDGDGHVLEMRTKFVELIEDPYGKRYRDAIAAGIGVGLVPGDASERFLRLPSFAGKGHKAEDWLDTLELGGLEGSVLYPTTCLGLGIVFDPDMAIALSRAYNTWVSSEICARGEGRLFAVAVLAPQDPVEASKELERAVTQLGLVGGMLPADGPHLLGDRRYDVVYEKAQELDVPVAVHGSGSPLSVRAFPRFIQSHAFNHPAAVIAQFTSMMFEGVPARFDALRLGFLEIGVTWVPWYIDRLDEEWELRGAEEAPALQARPSSYLGEGKRIFFGFECGERQLASVLPLVGRDAVMYASDWPHWDNEYPKSMKDVQERTELGEDDKAALLGGSAKRFYRLPVE